MAELIADSVYAILTGVTLNLGIFAFFFAYYARTPLERIGFLLCTLALTALFVYTITRLTFSWWLSVCCFVGFAIAAMTLTHQTMRATSPHVLDLAKIRKASKSSRGLSSMTLSLIVLILPVGFFIPTSSIAKFTGSLALLLVVVIAICIISDYLARPSRLACFLSALSAFLLALGCLIPFDNLIRGRSGLGVTLGFSICAASAVYLFSHATAVSKLSPYELALANTPGSRSLFSSRHSLARPGVSWFYASSAWLMDILARLSSGLGGLFKLLLVGAIVFLTCFAPWTISSWDLVGLRELMKWEVISLFLGFHSVLLLGMISFFILGGLLERVSRFLSRADYASTIQGDKRPPILFLRAFRDDQGTLPRLPWYRRLWLGKFGTPTLDHLLIEEFSLLGPVVALGAPGEGKPPFGASRLYVHETKDWMAEVVRIARSALAIVVVCADSTSLNREMDELAAANLLPKVLFLASPDTPSKGLKAHPHLGQMIDESSDSVAVGFYQVGEARRTLVCDVLEAEDYLVCCKAFFTELADPSSVPRAFDRLVLPAVT